MIYLKRFESYGSDKRIVTTYEIITPESVENGDFSESGWYDEQGESMVPDEYDKEEGITVVDKAAEFLKNKCANEPSSSVFSPGIWYYTIDPEQNYLTGEDIYYSYHLKGFTEEEEFEIYKIMTDYEGKKFKKEIDKYNL